jgi:Zn-dependent peptidase ImmA (M78 family)
MSMLSEGLMIRRYIVIIIVFLLGATACSVVSTATQTPTSVPTNTSISTSVRTSISTPIPTAAVTPSPTSEEPTKTPYPTSEINSQLSSEIDLIQTQVVEERQLQPKYAVPVVLLTTDELRTNVINDFLADYTDEKISDDLLELSIIGLLKPDFDLRTLYINLLSEQIAGYYDNETKEMFVVSDQGFQGPERLTYAHEYTHALQDQNYDIAHGLNYNDDACEKDTERCAAVQALIEGDATLSQTLWYQYYATVQDQQQIAQYYNSLKSPVYDSAPAFLKEDFVFPYNQGATFVQDIYSNGGWSAINTVYHNPPVDTEQILHPNLYPSDKPITVTLPDLVSTLGTGWREVDRNTMGEWYTYLVLADGDNTNARLSTSTAQAAAAGWGGDEYLVLHNDSSNLTVFVMKTVWDTTDDASQFASSFQQYANARFGVKADQQGGTWVWSYSGGYTTLQLSGATTIWITAPDASTAQTIASQVQP